MKNLPIGIQTFSEIINNNYLYVDKTKEIHSLITIGKYFFISRPRRFGKSLLVSTLKEIFEGNKELFKNLYIYDKIDWMKYPVIHIDFMKMSYKTSELLDQSLNNFLNQIAKEYIISFETSTVKEKFGELIQKIYELTKLQVVILIDEYDKPIIDHLPDIEKAKQNREVLKEFYDVLKGCDPYLKILFITGVSKFSKVSIFSGLNNLDDLTVDDRFSTITGVTQEDLLHYFSEYIKVLAKKLNMQETKLIENIKYWYDGYSWDGTVTIYNPLSLLKLFSKNTFKNYWFETGTPTFLIKMLKEKNYKIPEIENSKAGDLLFESYDLDNIETLPLLFQTGYITIKSIKLTNTGNVYILSYPNFEVKESFLNHLLASFAHAGPSSIMPLTSDMVTTLENNDIKKFIDLTKSLLAGIPYSIEREDESYYHTVFYLIATLIGLKLDPEILTNQGRIDGVLELDDKIYIIEFKYSKEEKDLGSLSDKAILQIKDKKYYEKYLGSNKKIILLGVGFVDKKIEYKVEELK